jgi:galactokinase/mevalonate kinase-like predicted kinase
MHLFDFCIITASNQRQADDFTDLIERRRKHGLYPRELNFKIVPDPPSGRVGNGGSTILALHDLINIHSAEDPKSFFKQKKILIIHAGGASRRQPCYAPEGKLFAPVPVPSSSIFSPILLDLQLTLFLKYPWKKGEVLITSGDVVIDFDLSTLTEKRDDICGFVKAESIEKSSRHGVFAIGDKECVVTDYFQKASIPFLIENALIEGSRECAIDMGLLSLSPDFITKLMDFSLTPYHNNITIIEGIRESNIQFNLYLELMTACIKRLSFAQYRKRIESKTSLSLHLLKLIYQAFHPFELKAFMPHASTFLHFGSINEFYESCLELTNRGLKTFYAQDNEELKPQVTSEVIYHNSTNTTYSVIGGKRLYIENVSDSYIRNAMGMNMFVGMRKWHGNSTIPEYICLEQRDINGSSIRLVYSIHDTFLPQKDLKSVTFCGISMDKWLNARKLEPRDIWDNSTEYDLITAKLFFPDCTDDFIEGYWNNTHNEEWTMKFRYMQKLSIDEINKADDVLQRDEQRINIRKKVLRDLVQQNIGWKRISIEDFKKTFSDRKEYPDLRNAYEKTSDPLLKIYRKTLLSSLMQGEGLRTLHTTSNLWRKSLVQQTSLKVGIENDQIVWARAPVRIDLAGGWSDTPPHTFRYGGQVVNVSVNLNGQPPVQVFCRKNQEPYIRFNSIDLGISETIHTYDELERFTDPTSPFSLPKAAAYRFCLNRNLFPHQTLKATLLEMGAGIDITLLCAVPKGSGLGTSSILGATIFAALYRFFDVPFTFDELIDEVLELEQMLTTGGGWQDQVGGIIGGVKYIERKPGLDSKIVVHQLDSYLFEEKSSLECFTLLYTGLARLAKNILQDVVLRANENTPLYIFTLKYIKQLAVDAKEAISRRNIFRLADIISSSWEANKRIHYSATNNEIEYLLEKTRPYYSGVKLLGAGGGGYALFVSQNPEQAKALRKALNTVRINNKARITDISFNPNGLQISVS